MADAALDAVVRYLRRMAVADGVGALADAELLERFVETRDEAAFEVLVWRHGGLVFGLCKKLLHNVQDAEDAFQAVFLTLSRKPPAVVKNESLAGWLHQVACRIALRLRSQIQKRRSHEQQDIEKTIQAVDTRTAASVEQSELWGAVIEELHHLPERYRRPVISCYLQGKTHVEAARELNKPAGSMSRVLDLGCQLLNARLSRRGVCLSAGGSAALLADRSWAALPPTFVQPVVDAAIQFTRGSPVAGTAAGLARATIKGMLLGKVKIAAGLVVLFCVLTGGAVGLARHGHAQANFEVNAAKQPAGIVQQLEERKSGVDAFGDPLPAGTVARLGTTRWRQGSPVICLAISPDGTMVASGGQEGGIRLWDSATGKQIGSLSNERSYGADSIVFSPNGQIVASTSQLSSFGADLWDVKTRKWLRGCERQPGQTRSGVAFSPDGATLAVSSNSEFSFTLYDAATGKQTRSLAGHAGGVHGITFSKDGRTLASAGADGTARLWDTATAKETACFKHPEAVMAVALDPNERWLATKTTRSNYLWDLETGKEKWSVETAPGVYKSLAFSPDGKLLSSEGPYPAGGIVWEVPSGKQVVRFDWEYVNCMAFAPNGRDLVMGGADGVIRLWEVSTNRELPVADGPRGRVSHLAFGLDEKSLFTFANGSKEPRLWNATTGKELQRFPVKDRNDSLLAVSPNGKMLLMETALESPVVIDTVTRLETCKLTGHKRERNYGYLVETAAFSPDNKIVATGGHDGTIRLWDVIDGRSLRVFPGNGSWVQFVAFFADGKTLISRTEEGKTCLWDVDTGKERRLQILEVSLWDAISLDGKYLAVKCQGGKGYVIHLHETATGKLIHTFDGLKSPERSLAFSPDGKTLAFGDVRYIPAVGRDHVLRLWETETGKERGLLTGHEGSVSELAFSPNGRFLASGSADTTTLVWDLAATVNPNKAKSSPLNRAQTEGHWADLASEDAHKAYQAIWSLIGDPANSTPFLAQVMKPVPSANPAVVQRLLDELDSDRSATREKAEAELGKLGESALPLLRQAVKGNASAEVQRRVQQLIEKAETLQSPDQIRLIRAIEVLEQLATPQAKTLLETLAAGSPQARLTREAAATRDRLRK